MEAEDEVIGCLSYKELYHASVERSENLQEHLGREYSQLLARLGFKHMKIIELKVYLQPCRTAIIDMV